MKYAQINQQNEVLAFPRTLQQFVETAVITSETATTAELNAAGVVEVEYCTTAAPDDEYLKELQAVRQLDGSWKEQWVRLETTDEYKTAATIRKKQQVLTERQYLLSITDWTQMPDVQLTNRTEWAAYRQLLRDIPTQTGFPFTIEWPNPPNR
jgi:hypothetical protein